MALGLNRHRALALWWSMIFSENRYPLFRIMLKRFSLPLPALQPAATRGVGSQDALEEFE
jgi:hypothetical protein